MASARWMIYGANGYTGQLIAEEAVRRGHRPVLAGRSAEKVAPLAERLGLEWKAFGLGDAAAVAREIEGCAVVLHAAGPFVHTATPMMRACLDAGASYTDITGELTVLQQSFAHDAEAHERGVCLVSGVGFDVIPTDCLAKYVAEKVPGATRLDIAIAPIGSASGGTLKSMIEGLPQGGFVRRGGELVPSQVGSEVRQVRFSDRERLTVAIPWGDLETAYHSTGIGDITTYLAQPPGMVKTMRVVTPMLGAAMRVSALRKLAQAVVGWTRSGPDAAARESGKSYVWARAAAPDGREAQAWLETLEGYAFTAVGGVRSIEQIIEKKPVGALTPSLAFGADFVLGIEGTKRLDTVG